MRWDGSPVSGHWTATPLSSGWGSPPALKLATPAACWPLLSGRKATIQEWTDGQTITAAIGQSYNLFTPLQLANYVATLVGGGDHYQAHLLRNVKAYDNSRLLYMYDDKPMNTVEISDSTLSAVTRGMHELTVSGSVAYAFENCVVSAGAKTGSAQVGTDIANGVFVAYAPYEKPEIAVAIVIEKGGSGAALANTAVEIINSWFSRAQDGTAIGENTLLK